MFDVDMKRILTTVWVWAGGGWAIEEWGIEQGHRVLGVTGREGLKSGTSDYSPK